MPVASRPTRIFYPEDWPILKIFRDGRDNFRPGTLALRRDRLEPTHTLTIRADDGLGRVYGHRRAS